MRFLLCDSYKAGAVLLSQRQRTPIHFPFVSAASAAQYNLLHSLEEYGGYSNFPEGRASYPPSLARLVAQITSSLTQL